MFFILILKKCMKLMGVTNISMYWVSQKKVWCRKLQYFTNGATYQCNILRHGTCNFYLGVCKVSIQYVKGNVTRVMTMRGMMGQNGLG